MVSALYSGSSSPGSSPNQGTVLYSRARFFTFIVPLSKVYKSVPANLMLGVTLQWSSIPSKGEQKHLELLHAKDTRTSSGLMGHLIHMQTLPYLFTDFQ